MKKIKPTTATISFSSPEAAEHFLHWLCGAGEQDYWEWMRCREEEEEGPITALNFDYDWENNSATGNCGRWDDPNLK